MTAGINKMGQRRLQLQPVKARIVFGHDRPLGDRPKSHHDKPRPAELDSGGSGRFLGQLAELRNVSAAAGVPSDYFLREIRALTRS